MNVALGRALVTMSHLNSEGKKLIEWASIDKYGSLEIDWKEVFEKSQDYDHGERTFDSVLGKLIALIQKEAFEKGLEAGLNQDTSISKLLVQTGGNA
jgi:hypothetical protein